MKNNGKKISSLNTFTQTQQASQASQKRIQMTKFKQMREVSQQHPSTAYGTQLMAEHMLSNNYN